MTERDKGNCNIVCWNKLQIPGVDVIFESNKHMAWRFLVPLTSKSMIRQQPVPSVETKCICKTQCWPLKAAFKSAGTSAVLILLECVSSQHLPRSLGQILRRWRHLMPPRWLEVENKHFTICAGSLNSKLLEHSGYFKNQTKRWHPLKVSLANEKKIQKVVLYANSRNVMHSCGKNSILLMTLNDILMMVWGILVVVELFSVLKH